LYAALDRLQTDRLIEVDREEIACGRFRRYYRLTPEGGRQLSTEAGRLRANAAVALQRLTIAGGIA
jgi:DNA-binding PadR family transcriptional regulator